MGKSIFAFSTMDSQWRIKSTVCNLGLVKSVDVKGQLQSQKSDADFQLERGLAPRTLTVQGSTVYSFNGEG